MRDPVSKPKVNSTSKMALKVDLWPTHTHTKHTHSHTKHTHTHKDHFLLSSPLMWDSQQEALGYFSKLVSRVPVATAQFVNYICPLCHLIHPSKATWSGWQILVKRGVHLEI